MTTKKKACRKINKIMTETLRLCPCCGHGPLVNRMEHKVTIACGEYGCRIVEAKTYGEAAALWNEPRFSDAKRPIGSSGMRH